MSDILETPTQRMEAVLECAGNPTIGSAASNGVWEGVPLAYILDQAGAAREAVAVLLEGADSGRLLQDSPEIPYCQIVPAEKCFPARALFPGWYGMDSVKWLQRVVVLGPSDLAPNFQLSGMNKLYNRMIKIPASELKITRLTEMQVRSVIAWPPDNTRLPLSRYAIRGFAWTGTGLIRSVNFSADGGRAWAPTQLESPPRPFT